MRKVIPVLLCALLALPVVASARRAPPDFRNDPQECKRNYKQQGSFLSGRIMSTRAFVPGVTKKQAVERVVRSFTVGGLKITNVDKEMGLISAYQLGERVARGYYRYDRYSVTTVAHNVSIEAKKGGVMVDYAAKFAGGIGVTLENAMKS